MSELHQFHAFFTILSFLWGACVGSFLNVCIYRIPNDLSIVAPRSHCPHCKAKLRWYHNIPILAYLVLRARCAFCGARIAPRYVLVELLVGVLFLLAWLKLPLVTEVPPLGLAAAATPWQVPVYWLIVWGLVLGTFVDLEHLIIPDRVTLGGIVAGLALSPLVPALHGVDGALHAFLLALLGLAVGWGLLWGVAAAGRVVFKREAMGFGDVKLMGAVGAFFGWQGVLFTLMASSLAGSVVGIALVASGRKEMQSRIPYGPYIALAALVWMYWGPRLWAAYASLFTFQP